MADVFEVVADPTRRKLLQALRFGERSVGELVEKVAIGQPGVSKQLRILTEAGFVASRQDGQRRFYSLRAEPFQQLDGWINDYRELWNARFDRLAAHIAKKKQRKGMH